MDDSDRPDEEAEVGIVGVWKYSVEYSWSEAVNIHEPFPSFIAARDLQLGIARGSSEGGW